MQVRVGDTVKMRDGRIVGVTDAADSHPDAWRTYGIRGIRTDAGWVPEEYITSEMPAETIFVGTDSDGATVVSDMSEVVSILN